MTTHKYAIKTTWNGNPINHDTIKLVLSQNEQDRNYLDLDITSPFFNSPEEPAFEIGEFFNLWDYEGRIKF
jgi:hypothetical protein